VVTVVVEEKLEVSNVRDAIAVDVKPEADDFAGREPSDTFHWMRVVRRLRLGRRRTGLRATLLTLASWAKSDGSSVHPSVETLANATEQSRRTVLRHLALLRDVYRLIGRISRGGGRGRRGLTSRYQLTLPDDLLERFELLDPDHRPVTAPAVVEPPPADDPPLARRDRRRLWRRRSRW
jgi:hypothetical protein